MPIFVGLLLLCILGGLIQLVFGLLVALLSPIASSLGEAVAGLLRLLGLGLLAGVRGLAGRLHRHKASRTVLPAP